MSCESCTGCFEATPCSAPAPSVNGLVSKEYRQFLKAARVCSSLQTDQDESKSSHVKEGRRVASRSEREDHAFNTLISILASNQFTAQTYLAQAYKQMGPRQFLIMAQTLAHHGFWGRLVTWAFLHVKEDSPRLQRLLDQHDAELLQTVNDEAEMFEVFNPAVSCQRVAWSMDPIPHLNSSG
ncbi:hypothetical protein EDD11_002508 [Mortierella claussenii]|nr:hypothetical protein EDD11_002508 [Mortierella claussenii]